MSKASESASYQRDIAAERAYRRGFRHGMIRAVQAVGRPGVTADDIRRWMAAIDEWRGVPFTHLLPIEPPPECEVSNNPVPPTQGEE